MATVGGTTENGVHSWSRGLLSKSSLNEKKVSAIMNISVSILFRHEIKIIPDFIVVTCGFVIIERA